MKVLLGLLVTSQLALATPALAQTPAEGVDQIDYNAFAVLTEQVQAIREQRLLTAAEFFERSSDPDVLVLDTRSAASFELGHIDGAVNLPFSDFTEETLRETIGANKGRPILIYCNNNFNDDVVPIALKKAPLALNIPTFINLIGYGYTNVWELGETIATSEANWVTLSTQLGG